MEGQSTYAVDGVGGECHQPAVAQDVGSVSQGVGIGGRKDFGFQSSTYFSRATATPSSPTSGATQSAAARAAGEALPMATPTPAHSSMGASLSLSPTASTASRATPR